MNLLSNAFKYGPGAAVTLSVSVEKGRGGHRGPRSRSGRGPPSDFERIFERFERGSPRQNQGGLGLGLYVSRQIAQAHGGTIAGRNLPEGGALFTVRLPLAGIAAT